jgi:SAM-dependent methyltransferase
MQASEIDAAEFRKGQRGDWDSASQGWRDWTELIDAGGRSVSERMVAMAGIEAGHRILDVAAGTGEPSLTAARVVGAGGSVVCSDISAGMLSFARERAVAAGLENMEFVESGAISLDFPTGSFDAALSRFGIIFEPDGEGAAERVRGFLKPGARMAVASWGTPDRVPFLALPMMTVMQRLSAPPPPPGTPGPLSRPTPEAIAGLLQGGGFSDVEVDELEVSYRWSSPEEFTRFLKEIAPPLVRMIDPHPPEVQADTWNAITDAVRPRTAPDGTLELSNQVLVAAGRA